MIDWEPLPAVAHAIDALKDYAPQLWDHVPGNRTLEAHLGDEAATEAAFARATHRVHLKSWVQRVTGVHMEPRAVVAAWDEAEQLYTVHASHGIGVVQMRDELAVVLGVPKERVRVIAPQDVGGNFGTRNATYPEWRWSHGRRGGCGVRSPSPRTARRPFSRISRAATSISTPSLRSTRKEISSRCAR